MNMCVNILVNYLNLNPTAFHTLYFSFQASNPSPPFEPLKLANSSNTMEIQNTEEKDSVRL